MRPINVFSLYGINGQRKYLNKIERKQFFQVAEEREECKRLFFLMLYYSGARISEVLNLQKQHLDINEFVVVIESLKKRKKGIYRAIPLPKDFIRDLAIYTQSINLESKIWQFSRRTASRYVDRAMQDANIIGLQASSKGLRHSFAVCAIENNVPLNLIKNWMGHSSISTTEIYLNVVGQEERTFARRMWESQ